MHLDSAIYLFHSVEVWWSSQNQHSDKEWSWENRKESYSIVEQKVSLQTIEMEELKETFS